MSGLTWRTKKSSPLVGGALGSRQLSASLPDLGRLNLTGAGTLGAATHFKFNFLTVFEGGVAINLDFGVMDKEIFAAVFRLDESIAFFGVKPLYCSCAHIRFIFLVIRGARRLRASQARAYRKAGTLSRKIFENLGGTCLRAILKCPYNNDSREKGASWRK